MKLRPSVAKSIASQPVKHDVLIQSSFRLTARASLKEVATKVSSQTIVHMAGRAEVVDIRPKGNFILKHDLVYSVL